jgi:4a-hydroxytetrahydrobiopterin dehydratase
VTSPGKGRGRTPPPLLDAAAVTAGLAALPGWRAEGGALRKEFTFPDFAGAFAFMTRVAAEAERLGHHPDWSNSYRRVVVALSTHESGGITQRDLDLARACEEAAGGRGG